MFNFDHRFCYALLMTGMLFAFPARGDFKSYQSTPTVDCAANYVRVERAVEFARVGASADLPPLDRRLATLEPHLAKWIQIKNSPAWTEARVNKSLNFRQNPMQKVGEKLTVGDKEFEILARLGQGAEASVYLVETPEGLRSAKVFYNDRKFADHWRTLRAETSMRIPKIFTADTQRKTMLLEHLAVVPIEEIERHHLALGITDLQKADIMARWSREKLRMRGSRSIEPANYNVGYSFRDSDFQMFDPY